MKKKNVLIVLVFLLVVILSLSIISAGWWERITGKAINGECTDSDGGFAPFDFGTIHYTNRDGSEGELNDFCLSDGYRQSDALCTKQGFSTAHVFNCPYGCVEGVCKKCNGAGECVDDAKLQCFYYKDWQSCLSNNCLWIYGNDADYGYCKYGETSNGGGGNGNQTCTDTCSSLGYSCGTYTICGTSTNCGTCGAGYICSGGSCILESGNPTGILRVTSSQFDNINVGVRSTSGPYYSPSGAYTHIGVGPGDFTLEARWYSVEFSKEGYGLCWWGITIPENGIYVADITTSCLIPPREPICTDSDGGKNYYEKGVANELYDRCLEDNYLLESFCITETSTYANQESYLCPYKCVDGACVNEGDNQTCTDTCSSLSKSCGTHTICGVSTNCGTCRTGYRCSEGIAEGTAFCMRDMGDQCYDLDSKDNPLYFNGLITLGNDSYKEYCIDQNQVVEFYCDNNIVKSETYDCEFGCRNGYCLDNPALVCTETDGGDDPYNPGVVYTVMPPSSGLILRHADYCSSPYGSPVLVEQIMDNCDSNMDWFDYPATKEYSCENGCVDGACVGEGGNQTCTDTCSSLEYICGTQTICGVNTNCGTCGGGYICSGGGCVVNQTEDSANETWSGEDQEEKSVEESKAKITETPLTVEESILIGENVGVYSEPKLTESNGEVYADNTANNEKIQIRVSPDEAVRFFKEFVEIGMVQEIKINEYEDKIIYDIETIKKAKLFGFLKLNAKIKMKLDANTGEIVKLERPWWRIFTTNLI